MEVAQILDIVASLASLAIVFLGVWVRTLIDEIKYLKSAVSSLNESNEREHGMVMASVDGLSRELTYEVRGIVAQHHDHDKEMVKLACKIDRLSENK